MRISYKSPLLSITAATLSTCTRSTLAFVTPKLTSTARITSTSTGTGTGTGTGTTSTINTRLRTTKLQDSFLDDNEGIINKLNKFSMSTRSSCSKSKSKQNMLNDARRRVNNRHSSNDWLHNMLSIPKSTVLRDIRNPVLSIASWATFISIIHKLLLSSSNNTHLTNLAAKMSIGTHMHSLMISSLGLLLVFRTNSAYQRFVEGRKIWEEILGISRNLDRMMSLYKEDIGAGKINRIKHYLASFPYLLRHHIRPRCLGCDDGTPIQYRVRMEELPYDIVETRHEGDTTNGGIIHVDDDVDTIDATHLSERPNYCWVDKRNLPWRLLDDNTMKKCSNAINRPLWACNSIADEVVTVPYNPNFTSRERLTILSQVNKLSNAIGQCERIHQTAVPLNYARHALRSLSIWLFTLPFALVKDLGLLTGPICAITAWLMFGVYQIGHSIEDPFQKTLRLSSLCNAIRRDVLGENKYRTSPASADNVHVIDEYEENEEGGNIVTMEKEILSSLELTKVLVPQP